MNNLSSINTAISGIRTEPTENEIRASGLYDGPYTDEDRDNKYYTLTKDLFFGGKDIGTVRAGSCALGSKWTELARGTTAVVMWTEYLRNATDEEVALEKASAN